MTEEQRTALSEAIDIAQQCMTNLLKLTASNLDAVLPSIQRFQGKINKAKAVMHELTKGPPDLFDLEEARRMLENQHNEIRALQDRIQRVENLLVA